MDIVEDERDGIQKRRSVVTWDKRKKKYVRETLGHVGEVAGLGLDDRARKRLRDEGGKLRRGGGSAKDEKNLYDGWKKASKRRIQAPGEAEEGGGGPEAARRRVTGRRWHTKTAPLPNSDVRSEIKSADEIRKNRKLAEKRKGGGKGGGRKGGGGGGKGGGKKGGGGKGGGGKGRGGGGRGGGGGEGKGEAEVRSGDFGFT